MRDSLGRTLLIRADASSTIGTGHVMRCLALAQAWQDAGGHAIFMMVPGARALEERLKSEGIELISMSAQPGSSDDRDQTVNLAQQVGASWVVVDGYHFGADYQRFVRDAGLSLLFVDDNGHVDRFCADIVLNQNLHADEDLYPNREPYTQLLLGTRYVLLRREFLKYQGWKREVPEVARRVLVTLGGGDPHNVTLRVIQTLQHVAVDDLEVVVVVGGSNPHYEELQPAIRHSRIPIRVEHHVTNMPELMAWADVGISGAGTTAWELAFMGLPSLVIVLADNQCGTAEHLDVLGAARNLGCPRDLSCDDIGRQFTNLVAAETRAEMSRHGRELVDGAGASRVVMRMTGAPLGLRVAREEDCRLLWGWANEPEARASAFSTASIEWADHLAWFERKLQDPNCRILIAVDQEEKALGQVRFDWNEAGDAEVDLSLEKSERGSGLGCQLLHAAVQKMFQESPVQRIHAYVKLDNMKSLRTFEKAGFKNLGVDTVRGHKAMHFARAKADE